MKYKKTRGKTNRPFRGEKELFGKFRFAFHYEAKNKAERDRYVKELRAEGWTVRVKGLRVFIA